MGSARELVDGGVRCGMECRVVQAGHARRESVGLDEGSASALVGLVVVWSRSSVQRLASSVKKRPASVWQVEAKAKGYS